MPEETSKSLVNIDLAKPITRLVDTVASGIGTLYEPTKIRRLALAQSDADIIKAKTEIAKSELAERASQRIAYTEIKRQEIIEKIIGESAKILAEKANTLEVDKKVDESWAMNFFDNCKDVTDESVQEIWGKILAGEVENPGTFKRKTVNLMKNLDANDAKLINLLGNSCWIIGQRLLPVITEQIRDGLNVNLLNYEQLLHLESLGIINFNQVSSFILQKQPKQVRAWHEHWHKLEFPAEQNDFIFGCVNLTDAGSQLVRVCKRDFNDLYFNHVIGKWSDMGLIISSDFPKNEK